MSKDSELDLDLLLDEDELNSSDGAHEDDDLDDKERHPVTPHDDDDDTFFEDDDDEEAKPVARGKPSAKTAVSESDDAEEDEEEEEIIKPAINPTIMGLGALAVVVLAGGAGYVLLNKNNNEQNNESPIVNTSMPAPSFEELGKDLSIPSTNLVDEDADKPLVADATPAQVIAPVVVTPVHADKGVVEPVTAPVKMAESLVKNETAVAPHDSLSAGQGIANAPTPPVVPVVTPVANTVVADADDNVSKQELKQMVADAMKDVVSANQSDELKAEVESLKKELGEAKSHPTSEAALNEYKAKVIGEIKQNRERKELAKIEANKQLVEKATEGKKRLPGFQVVNATVDGQISIIKAPSGRTFALFKGEKFKATNGSLLEVKEIVAEGKLVVAGDNWFIDDVVEKVQKIEPTKVVSSNGAASATKPVFSKKKESSATVEKTTSVNGWSFHASFEGGGYLVKTPSGEYKTVKKGESESGLGVIYGVDDSGNLKTEKGVIKGDM